ncbi:MAG TPA: YciI family protein, partial [Salegentibacter sp.]|nr:YciI family protein [Salegentibacter sp.]
FLGIVLSFSSCDQTTEKTQPIQTPENAAEERPQFNIDSIEKSLKEKGYQTFRYEEEDTTYLMQQYYMVFLKRGENRNQDSTEAANLQKQHMAHLSRMSEEGYASLIGPFGSDGEIRGIAIYNTATEKEADSLANLDPMVKAGRLKVEVHPWWTSKGGKLN